MIRSQLFLVTFLVFGFIVMVPAGSAESGAIIPVRPTDLIACLPGAGIGWKLTQSNAEHLRQDIPMSKAIREYTFQQQNALLVRSKITLLDTGAAPEIIHLYDVPEAGAQDTRGERLTIAGLPAVKINTADTARVEALAFQRFLIIVEITGSPTEKPEEWIKRIDFAKLQSHSNKVERLELAKRSYPFTLERVDELDPKRSRSTRAYIGEDPPKD